MYIGMFPLLSNVCPHEAVIPSRASCLCKLLLVSVSNTSAEHLVVGDIILFASSVKLVISSLVVLIVKESSESLSKRCF